MLPLLLLIETSKVFQICCFFALILEKMLINTSKIFAYLLGLLLLMNCANRGSPTGGIKDIIPPKILRTIPENYSLNFNAKEVRIYFDEYVKFKDLNKQLIISPPMENAPEITPIGLPQKYVSIKILDTLQPNTTYAINFGTSIVDNNESNPLSYYRYVFSTGAIIDSLELKGYVKDALERKTENFVSVMLYEVDSSYTDSLVFKSKPRYVTNTLDSVTDFNIKNVKAGTYKLFALKEESQNFTYQPRTDKIAFRESVISLPRDTSENCELKLFKRTLDNEFMRPFLISTNKIGIGFEGTPNFDSIKVIPFGEKIEDYTLTKSVDSDTIFYWYNSIKPLDSLKFNFSENSKKQSYVLKTRALENDSLKITPEPSGVINFQDQFKIKTNNPISKIDQQKFLLIDKDSLAVKFQIINDEFNSNLKLDFTLEEAQRYSLKLLPGALTDFFGEQNDTLNFSFRTKTLDDYGSARININNTNYPIIVQLVNEKGDVKFSKYLKQSSPIDFNAIEAGVYYLRVIQDTNKNLKWDSGHLINTQQPEKVSYFPNKLEVRAGWEQIYDFTLLD